MGGLPLMIIAVRTITVGPAAEPATEAPACFLFSIIPEVAQLAPVGKPFQLHSMIVLIMIEVRNCEDDYDGFCWLRVWIYLGECPLFAIDVLGTVVQSLFVAVDN